MRTFKTSEDLALRAMDFWKSQCALLGCGPYIHRLILQRKMTLLPDF